MKSGNIAIDLDGVILNFNWAAWERNDMNYFGAPMKGAIEALKELKRRGYRLIIFTCRTNPVLNNRYPLEELYKKVKKILRKHKIPHDEIWIGAGKPLADYYIDDSAIKFENWEQTLREVPLTNVEIWKEEK